MTTILITKNFQLVIQGGQYNGKTFRYTNDNPRKVSVIDWIMLITNNSKQVSINTLNRLISSNETVKSKLSYLQFPGERQRPTPVATASDLLFIIGKLPHKYIAVFEKERDNLITRYLGGDTSLSREVAVIRTRQESLPQDHPMRVFGEAVESGQVGHMNEEPVYLDERSEFRAKAIESYHGQMAAMNSNPITQNMRMRIDANIKISKAALGMTPSQLRKIVSVNVNVKRHVSSRDFMDVTQLKSVAYSAEIAKRIAENCTSKPTYNSELNNLTKTIFDINKQYKVHGYKNMTALPAPIVVKRNAITQ
jgi:hypothetical protein